MSAFAELGIAIRERGRIEQRVACPYCAKGRHDDALGVNVRDGRFHCFRCGWSGRAGSAEVNAPANIVMNLDDPRIAARKRERLRRIWSESVPLTHTKAHATRAYLSTRGLAAVLENPSSTTLRAHPQLEYFEDGRVLDAFPAMLALFSGSGGEHITLHATYLRADGGTKALVRSPKKLFPVPVRGATRGGAIRLHAPLHGVLGIAEGIESALSLHLIQRVPVWASYCAENLRRVRLPRSLKRLLIGVDIDENGKGEQMAKRLAHRICRWSRAVQIDLVYPDGEGPRDLNDELRRGAR